jgi:hypothetical protein
MFKIAGPGYDLQDYKLISFCKNSNDWSMFMPCNMLNAECLVNGKIVKAKDLRALWDYLGSTTVMPYEGWLYRNSHTVERYRRLDRNIEYRYLDHVYNKHQAIRYVLFKTYKDYVMKHLYSELVELRKLVRSGRYMLYDKNAICIDLDQLDDVLDAKIKCKFSHVYFIAHMLVEDYATELNQTE